MTPIFLFVGILAMTGIVLTASAQVEITQSQTTNDNGQKTSIKTENDKTTIKVLQGGTVVLTNDAKEFKIKYCDSGCHSYKLLKNGTMIKEN